MTNYWDKRFLRKIDNDIDVIFEVGSRYGDESIQLQKHFPKSHIYSFECNPNTIEIARKKLKNKKNITFIDTGLGKEKEILPFYSYIVNNDGASSFYKRIDFQTTQKMTGYVKINTISNIIKDLNIQKIDLLCMDVQGYELNVLKGAIKDLNKINYIIMEQPKKYINESYLPKHLHSKYINSPNNIEIETFMSNYNFIELERLEENKLEDNVLYKNKNFFL